MFVRILTVGLCLLLVAGCAKKTAKKPSSDDSASAKPTTPAPNDRDKKNDKKGEKDDGPNWLTDPRFKKDPPSTTPLPPDGPSPNKQPWGFAPPQGGWEGPNPGVGPIQPAGPGGMPVNPAVPGPPVPGPGPGPAAPPAPGIGGLQPPPAAPAAPMAPAAPGGTPTTPKYSPVTEADMKEVWVFVENRSGATGKMPTQLDIYQALVAAGSSSAPLVKDGSIYLTGATTRESIWAFETKALISGGLVCSQNGVETLTAAELKARLGK
jgi:hypothetical protein